MKTTAGLVTLVLIGGIFFHLSTLQAASDSDQIEQLIRTNRKSEIIAIILKNRQSKITIVDGSQMRDFLGAPDEKYVNASSILEDLKKMHVSVAELKKIIGTKPPARAFDKYAEVRRVEPAITKSIPKPEATASAHKSETTSSKPYSEVKDSTQKCPSNATAKRFLFIDGSFLNAEKAWEEGENFRYVYSGKIYEFPKKHVKTIESQDDGNNLVVVNIGATHQEDTTNRHSPNTSLTMQHHKDCARVSIRYAISANKYFELASEIASGLKRTIDTINANPSDDNVRKAYTESKEACVQLSSVEPPSQLDAVHSLIIDAIKYLMEAMEVLQEYNVFTNKDANTTAKASMVSTLIGQSHDNMKRASVLSSGIGKPKLSSSSSSSLPDTWDLAKSKNYTECMYKCRSTVGAGQDVGWINERERDRLIDSCKQSCALKY